MPDLKEHTRIGLAFATGVMSWLSFPTVGLWPLAFISWVPLILAIEGVRGRHALALGWLSGITMNALGCSFLFSTLTRFSGFSLPLCALLFLALSAYQGLRAGIFALLARAAANRGWPRSPALLVAFVTSELLFPMPFPWTFGAAAHQILPLAQVADLAGPIAISVVLVATNLGVAAIASRLWGRMTPDGYWAFAYFAAPLFAYGYGLWRIDQIDRIVGGSAIVRVGIVQPNLTPLHHDDGARRNVGATQRLAADGASLVVWSEATLPGPYPEEDLDGALRANVTSRLGVASVVGLTVRRSSVADAAHIFNSAVVADVDGTVLGRYDKRHLLPFGEYIPLADIWPSLYGLSPASGAFSAGGKREHLLVLGHRLAATICYEDVLPSEVRDLVRETDAELIVNLTNDGWFSGTNEPRTHLALARVRAIEHRRYLVRATSTGASALIDPVGRVVLALPENVEASGIGDARWMQMHTIYDSIGDAIWWICATASIALSVLPAPRRSRTSNAER